MSQNPGNGAVPPARRTGADLAGRPPDTRSARPARPTGRRPRTGRASPCGPRTSSCRRRAAPTSSGSRPATCAASSSTSAPCACASSHELRDRQPLAGDVAGARHGDEAHTEPSRSRRSTAFEVDRFTGPIRCATTCSTPRSLASFCTGLASAWCSRLRRDHGVTGLPRQVADRDRECRRARRREQQALGIGDAEEVRHLAVVLAIARSVAGWVRQHRRLHRLDDPRRLRPAGAGVVGVDHGRGEAFAIDSSRTVAITSQTPSRLPMTGNRKRLPPTQTGVVSP